MSKRHIIAVTILAGGLAAVAGTWAGRWSSARPDEQIAPFKEVTSIDGLVIDTQYLNFGEVHGEPDFAIRLPIQNVTDHKITIDEFQTACTCRPVEPKSLIIPAGETRDIRLVLDRDKLPPSMVGRSRTIDTEIRPVLHRQPASKAWKIRGTIHPLISTDLAALLFGESNHAGQPPLSRRVNIHFHSPGIAKVELMPPVAEARVEKGNADTEWSVVVTPFTDRAPGPFRGTLTITNQSLDGHKPIVSLKLPVEGVLREGDK